jgi:hypothetical protein
MTRFKQFPRKIGANMSTRIVRVMGVAVIVVAAQFGLSSAPAEEFEPLAKRWGKTPLDVVPKPLSSDPSIEIDYDIVYVRAPRFVSERDGRQRPSRWPEIGHPTNIDPGYDLVVLHADGSEEVLVAAGDGSIADPYVSFDGQWIYYTLFHKPASGEWNGGADIYKVHAKTREIVRLTRQQFTPNTGVADWSSDYRQEQPGKARLGYDVYNMHPCPLPGGRVAFVSNRDGLKSPQGYPVYALQLFVMDEDGGNVEKIGHLNVAGALHPVILTDGRIMFSSLESQGTRGNIQWGIWSIHPDGTNWEPIISAFVGAGASDAWHFQTELTDGSIVVELYYNQNTAAFGAHFRLPPPSSIQGPRFLAADRQANPEPDRMFLLGGPLSGPGPRQFAFLPVGMESITRFTTGSDQATMLSDPQNEKSPRLGKVAHPCGAPDNHLLTVYTPGAGPSGAGPLGGPQTDAGIYLIKEGKPIDEPGRMLLVKNDPQYNEQWPRPLVPYNRIYRVDEPKRLAPLANDGSQSPHLPEGTPFGLVGTSSLYKRETFPYGRVPEGSVTATGNPFAAFSVNSWIGLNWADQGADAGLYTNDQIHAIRILAMEPASSVVADRFYNRASERLRILGEFPVRKLDDHGQQPLDPDGNPDTSFLARVPADIAWTFQTLDKDGMVLNMAQTWHQVRPGEIRNNCGGCHAHSLQPTDFRLTAAAKPDYEVFDLTKRTPLLTTKAGDESGRQWDAGQVTGLRYEDGPKNVEYFRDVRPIFQRSCVACHSQKIAKPPADLVLDPEDDLYQSATYLARFRHVHHEKAMSGMKAVKGRAPFMINPRYVWDFQSRRSLLVWKIYGRRTDGLELAPVDGYENDRKLVTAIDYNGKPMPPADAIAGTYKGPDGKLVKVAPLNDEDKRTITRWIDLGCPIDWAYDPEHPAARGNGWLLDDQRPTLTLTYPKAGSNTQPLERILIGAYDFDTGLDVESLTVTADFEVNGVPPGQNLIDRFQRKSDWTWELVLDKALTKLSYGRLTVSTKDRQGNITQIDRSFSLGP